MRALVSASDVVAVLTTHLDRVHDVACRLGCSPAEATQASATAASALIDDLAERPEAVGDLVGGLYARARTSAAHGRRGGGAPVPMDEPPSLLDADEAASVTTALFDLPERRRLGLLLVDAYGLGLDQAAIALGLDAAETARTVALGRLALVAGVDRTDASSPAGHDVAVGDLGQLADGSAPAGGRFATLRRHVSSCAVCAQLLGVQTRGRALAAALPVHALPEADRNGILTRSTTRADAVLLSTSEVQAELDGLRHSPPLLPFVVVALALLLAVLAGVGVGLLLRN